MKDSVLTVSFKLNRDTSQFYGSPQGYDEGADDFRFVRDDVSYTGAVHQKKIRLTNLKLDNRAKDMLSSRNAKYAQWVQFKQKFGKKYPC